MQKSGVPSLAPAMNWRLTRRTAPAASLSGPTMKPGVSQRLSTGRSKASHSCRKRAAFSAPSQSMAPPRWRGSLAISPIGRPSMRTKPDVVDPQAVLRDGPAQLALVGDGPVGHAALEGRQGLFGQSGGVSLVVGEDVDHAIGPLHLAGADVVGLEHTQAAALDHGGTAHAEGGGLRGDDNFGKTGDARVAGEK